MDVDVIPPSFVALAAISDPSSAETIEPRNLKRKAESRQDNDRLCKKVSLLNLEPSTSRLALPSEGNKTTTSNDAKPPPPDPEQHLRSISKDPILSSVDPNAMRLDDTKHTVYIHDLAAELSSSSASSPSSSPSPTFAPSSSNLPSGLFQTPSLFLANETPGMSNGDAGGDSSRLEDIDFEFNDGDIRVPSKRRNPDSMQGEHGDDNPKKKTKGKKTKLLFLPPPLQLRVPLPDDHGEGGKQGNMQLILYSSAEPSSLSLPESEDLARRAMLEARARARARVREERVRKDYDDDEDMLADDEDNNDYDESDAAKLPSFGDIEAAGAAWGYREGGGELLSGGGLEKGGTRRETGAGTGGSVKDGNLYWNSINPLAPSQLQGQASMTSATNMGAQGPGGGLGGAGVAGGMVGGGGDGGENGSLADFMSQGMAGGGGEKKKAGFTRGFAPAGGSQNGVVVEDYDAMDLDEW